MTQPASAATPAQGYAGDLTPDDAYAYLASTPEAVFVDVRTAAEWAYVGGPDLSGIGREVAQVEWVRFPGGVPNDAFVDDVRAAGVGPGTPVVFLCRSGVRSVAAAKAATAAGLGPAYNILGGFEGDLDGARHRGSVGGWKAAGLAWVQS